jgi:hypothetical protein
MAALIVFGWLGLMAYVWLWDRSNWGWGWAIVGTIYLTALALPALGIVWLISRVIRGFANRPRSN